MIKTASEVLHFSGSFYPQKS